MSQTIALQSLDEQNDNVLTFRSKAVIEDVQESTKLMYGSEKNPDGFPDGGLKANIVLLGSFIGLIADFGLANSLGAIESYVSTHQLSHIKQTDVSWVFSLHLGVMYFGGVFFGELFDKFGARIPLTIGMIATTVGLLLTAQSTKLVHFIFSFSILTAIGTSLAMAPLIGALSHWFLKKRALACSIGTIGGLVGGTVFPVMLQNLYDKVGFIWGIRILALICMFCMSVSIALVRERDQKHNASEISSPEVESLTNQETENLSYHENEVSSRKNPFTSLVMFLKGALDFSVLKDSRFICLTLAIWLAEVISMTTLTYLSSYALSNRLENSQAYLLITIVNVCGIPSRFISGLFADHYGRFNVMIVTSVMTTVVIFAVWLPAKGNLNILYAFAVLFGISTSAVISLIPACTGQICSVDNFGKVYGTVYFFLAFLTILGMYIASLVISGGSTTNYRNFVLYEGGLGAASIVLWIYARYTAVGWKWCKF